MDIKQSSEKRFALLIDADNVSAKYIKPITDELSKYGTVTYKRIYGDWTLTLHAKWKDALLENSITPIQQFGYTQGKNATDSAMIIDAMDILYTRSVEGFCIVSSDSDFTRLASRIRESGLTVIGMGEKKTPTPFRKACDIFTTLELLLGDTGGKSGGRNRNRHDQGSSSNGQGAGTTTMSKDEIEQAVVNIITDNQNNGKSTGLGEVGSRLLKRYPDFDVRSYGTNLLSKLLDEFASVQIIKDGSSVAVVLAEGANAPKDASPEAEQAPETKQADDVKDAPVAESEGSTDAQGAAEAKPVEKKPASRRQPRRRKDQVAAQQGSEATEEKPVQEPELSAEPAGEQHDRLAEPVVEAEPAEQPPSDNRPGRAARMRAAASRSRGSEGRKQAGKKQTEKGERSDCEAEAQAREGEGPQGRAAGRRGYGDAGGARRGSAEAGVRSAREARTEASSQSDCEGCRRRRRCPVRPRGVHPPDRGRRRAGGDRAVRAGQARARQVPHVQAARSGLRAVQALSRRPGRHQGGAARRPILRPPRPISANCPRGVSRAVPTGRLPIGAAGSRPITARGLRSGRRAEYRALLAEARISRGLGLPARCRANSRARKWTNAAAHPGS